MGEGTKEYLRTKGTYQLKVGSKKHQIVAFPDGYRGGDVEAIKTFAGDDYEKAVYYPEDEGILLEFEEKVNHYENFSCHEKKACS